MESRRDVVVVSAFGRGMWLALELAKTGIEVSFVDVSQRLGQSHPEDWQGPFPLLKTSQLDDRQWDFLSEGCELKEIPNGFTFWLPTNPLELRGPLFDFLSNKNGFDPEVITYVRDFHLVSEPERRLMKHRIDKMTGHQNWLAHFAHQYTSAVFSLDKSTLEDGIPLNLFSPCFLRRMNKASIEMKYGEMKKTGIRMYLNSSLEDLSIQSRVIDGLEISGEKSGIVTGRNFVWTLTSEETARFNSRISKGLFDGQIVESSWCWLRFNFKIQEGFEREVLPDHFVMAKDIHLPWTHGNICLTEKTTKEGVFRIWIRVASGRRFQRSYISEMGEDIRRELQRRIPAVEVKIEDMPPEFHFGLEEMGPPRHPVYLKSELKKLNRLRIKNIYYSGPEDWAALDWGTRIANENRSFFVLTAEKKEEANHDTALHPN